MIRTAIVFLLWIIAVNVPAHSKEHASTADVCRADAAVWGDTRAETDWYSADSDFLENGVPNRSTLDKLSLKEIRSRVREMSQCQAVDPAQEDSYQARMRFYGDMLKTRYRDFILRHHFLSQLEQEDAAGKR